jgi:116 kDa U5 small nuclear ribonucleoprotein component
MYDEFGNYIGPELESDEESRSDAGSEPESSPSARSPSRSPPRSAALLEDDMDTAPSSQIVLAEDKKYYPTAEEVYGEDVETLVMDEDELPLEQPIIKPVREIRYEATSHTVPKARIPTEFLLGLAANPALVRNVALVGQLQHGMPFGGIVFVLFQEKKMENSYPFDLFLL